jgi:hypothetical protein
LGSQRSAAIVEKRNSGWPEAMDKLCKYCVNLGKQEREEIN